MIFSAIAMRARRYEFITELYAIVVIDSVVALNTLNSSKNLMNSKDINMAEQQSRLEAEIQASALDSTWLMKSEKVVKRARGYSKRDNTNVKTSTEMDYNSFTESGAGVREMQNFVVRFSTSALNSTQYQL